MRRKVLSLLLCSAMAVSLLAGCTGDGNHVDKSSERQQGEAKTETSEQLVLYMCSSGNMEDAGLVAEKVNEYIEPLIGASVELNFINMGSYSEQIGMMVRGGDQIDILFSFENDAKNYIRQEAIKPLDELLEQYGSGIVEQIGSDNLEAARYKGKIYSLPSLKDMAVSRMFVYDKNMADTAGVEMPESSDLTGLTEKFGKVKKMYPECSMFGGAGGNAINFLTWDWDILNDSFGVLMDNGQSEKVENLFETEEYKQLCELMREWYQAGFIEKDFATSSETWQSRMTAGTTFGGVTTYKPGELENVEDRVGKECGSVILTEAMSSTSTIVNTNWMIPESCENPEKAMEFLKLMYTDATVGNLLLYGIEGVHYKENSDGTITTIDYDKSKYQQNLPWAFGNQFICKVLEGNDPDVYEKTREFNNSAIKSKALGFSFDNSEVVNEVTACNNVANKYRTSLECGAIDPAEALPKFQQELKEAGIDKIMEQKQEQLEQWVGSK